MAVSLKYRVHHYWLHPAEDRIYLPYQLTKRKKFTPGNFPSSSRGKRNRLFITDKLNVKEIHYRKAARRYIHHLWHDRQKNKRLSTTQIHYPSFSSQRTPMGSLLCGKHVTCHLHGFDQAEPFSDNRFRIDKTKLNRR